MNIAVLTKLRVISGSPVQTIKELKQAIYRARIPGHYETAFYLSEIDPTEFYTFSLFLDPFQIPKLEELTAIILFDEPVRRLELVEYYAFQLMWEYRRVSAAPLASTIRLAIYPVGFPSEKIGTFTSYIRPHVRDIPGLLGVWVGQGSKHENIVRIARLDWSSPEEMYNTINSPVVERLQHETMSAGMMLEYSSYRLQDILLDEPAVPAPATLEIELR